MTPATSLRATRTRRRPVTRTTDATRKLQELLLANVIGDDLISKLVKIAAELTGALGVVFLPRDATKQLCLSPKYFSSPHIEHLRGLLRQIIRLGTVASTEESTQAGSVEGEDGIVVVAVPVFGGVHGTEALAAAVGVESEAQARTSAAYLKQILTWVAACLAAARNPGQDAQTRATNHLCSLHEMLAEAAKQENLKKSCELIAEWIRATKQAPEVAIGIRRGWRRQCQLLVRTGTRDLDQRSEVVSCLREVMEETMIADTLSIGAGSASLPRTSAVDQLTRHSGLTVVQRYPLRDVQGDTFGVVLVLAEQCEGEQCEGEQREAQPLSPEEQMSLGRQLGCIRATGQRRFASKLGISRTSKWYRHPASWLTAGMLTLLMMVPLPMIVKCRCIVQPQQRRFISVPYEGRLQQVLIEPGEVVREGQLLARMDDRDVTWEISKLNADLRHAEKQQDSALAAFDTSGSQMAGLQAERLRLQIEELQGRLDHLEIRSPIDGISIGGDPRKLEGARLSLGETLLEIGPLDKMVVELEIADEDIFHLKRRQSVQYRLDALPWRSFEGTIDLIRPQSEQREDANVFVAETKLDNGNSLIRPGMRGKARIKTARHPLAWNLFHKPWSNLMMWVAW